MGAFGCSNTPQSPAAVVSHILKGCSPAANSSPLLPRPSSADPIPRRALVSRHNIAYTAAQPNAPLTIGNGELAFTADFTGLQTFPDPSASYPLCTMAQWAWHGAPNPHGYSLDTFRFTPFDAHGRQVLYPVCAEGQQDAYRWLRENPHRYNLARIGLSLSAACEPVTQTLDLWTGLLTSVFTYSSRRIETRTACHPSLDALAFEIAPAFPVVLELPYPSPSISGAAWNLPDRHTSLLTPLTTNSARILHTFDHDGCTVELTWESPAQLTRTGPHRFLLEPRSNLLTFTIAFAPFSRAPSTPSPRRVFLSAARHWPEFWNSGAAIDTSAFRDPRAPELERRLVLSQYLTAIQCAGSLPPQETGLTCNSWFGKFHMEMYWWHCAHFALWGRAHLLERSLGFYASILPSAQATARAQGYRGARWPKMTAPGGRESPSSIGPLLVWQQPHPIFLAELCYRARPKAATLHRHAGVVFATADFLASFASWEPAQRRYSLGPPVIPAQENHPPRETWNPTFELEQFYEALGLALLWRRRLGLPPVPLWQTVRGHLAPLPVREGLYLAHENCPQTFTERNRDHPSMLAALGLLQGRKADPATMSRTLDKVLACWQWETTWGWDYPLIALTAARLGRPQTALDALFLDTPKNRWLPNGHTYQRPSLPCYLPSNGSLLYAAASIAPSLRASGLLVETGHPW